MIKRRDKVLRTYLPAVNPIVAPRLESDRLTFENAAVAAGVGKPPETYRASWFHFDNTTGATRPLGETTSTTTTIDVPRGLPTGADTFISAEISAESNEYPAWRRPVRTHFRRDADGWRLIGLERLPDDIANHPVHR